MAEQRYTIIGGRFVLRQLERRGGVWHCRYRDRVSGRIYSRSTRERERRRAERAAVRIVEEHLQRTAGGRLAEILFADAWDRWLRDKPGRPATLRDQGAVGRVLARALGDRLVSEISHADLSQLFGELAASRAPTTLRKYRTCLRTFYRWCARCRYCGEDPSQGVAVGRGGARDGVALSRAEAARLLEAAGERSRRGRPAPPYLHLAVLLALHAGLRKRNVLQLRWRQVDLAARRIDIPAEEMKAHRAHAVPIHAELDCALRRALRSRPASCEGYVLGRRVGEVLQPFRTALRRAGLAPMRWHDLRHTASTWWLEALPIAVAETLAARRLQGEAARYAHIGFPRLVEAIDELPWIIPRTAASRRRADRSPATLTRKAMP